MCSKSWCHGNIHELEFYKMNLEYKTKKELKYVQQILLYECFIAF